VTRTPSASVIAARGRTSLGIEGGGDPSPGATLAGPATTVGDVGPKLAVGGRWVGTEGCGMIGSRETHAPTISARREIARDRLRLGRGGRIARETASSETVWRAACGASRRSGYSPITDQMKPIMMKKPVNIAISPIPP
jgi:hypothetical protein